MVWKPRFAVSAVEARAAWCVPSCKRPQSMAIPAVVLKGYAAACFIRPLATSAGESRDGAWATRQSDRECA